MENQKNRCSESEVGEWFCPDFIHAVDVFGLRGDLQDVLPEPQVGGAEWGPPASDWLAFPLLHPLSYRLDPCGTLSP